MPQLDARELPLFVDLDEWPAVVALVERGQRLLALRQDRPHQSVEPAQPQLWNDIVPALCFCQVTPPSFERTMVLLNGLPSLTRTSFGFVGFTVMEQKAPLIGLLRNVQVAPPSVVLLICVSPFGPAVQA